jgi:hypothetical protein
MYCLLQAVAVGVAANLTAAVAVGEEEFFSNQFLYLPAQHTQ